MFEWDDQPFPHAIRFKQWKCEQMCSQASPFSYANVDYNKLGKQADLELFCNIKVLQDISRSPDRSIKHHRCVDQKLLGM